MAHLGLRTIYGQEDLKRASQAPGKIVGMYESMKGALVDNLDSGIGGEMEDELSLSSSDIPPAPPKLITNTDHEMVDSGLGGDVVEVDHVAAVETRTTTEFEVETADHTQSEIPTKSSSLPTVTDKPIPRRPRRTILPNPAAKMRYYNSPRQPVQTADIAVNRASIMSVPAQAESEVQRLHLQNQWQRILFQQQLNYLLPNKEGDT